MSPMLPWVLKINPSGMPQCWIDVQAAVNEIATDRILYSFGEICSTLHGGFNRDGVQSIMEIPQILVGRSNPKVFHNTPALHNRHLFARDGYRCMYCGDQFPQHLLSRDHIIPISRGGRNTWTNVVAACKRCNNYKGDKLLQECRLELLAVPYKPNRHEYLYLSNRRVLADQMEFLQKGFRNLSADRSLIGPHIQNRG